MRWDGQPPEAEQQAADAMEAGAEAQLRPTVPVARFASSGRRRTDEGAADASQRPTLPAAEAAEESLVGQVLGRRYRVTQLLGRGGMGEVYLAVDDILGQEVALKLLRPGTGTGPRQRVAELRREVLIAQRVTHRNVCRTYDLEEIDGTFLIKMEYVAGTTLAERLAEHGAMPVEEALSIARQVVAGLEAVHAEGIIHCDLKPENIFIEGGTGRVVLMDFGVARAQLRGEGPIPIAGTPAYMSPEQARAERLDARSDLYSLGCVLFHMLAGDVPYPANSPTEVQAGRREPPQARVNARLPEVPPWLRQLLRRLLDEDRERRYRTTREVLRALAGPERRRWRTARRAATIALLGLAPVVLWYGRDRRDWRPQVNERMPSYEEAATPPSISPDGQWLAYASSREGRYRAYLEPLGAGRSRSLPLAAQLIQHPLRWTHDGQALLYVDRGYKAWRVALADGAETELGMRVRSIDDCAGRLVLAYEDRSQPFRRFTRLVVRERRGDAWVERPLAEIPRSDIVRSLRCDRAGQRVVVMATGEMLVPRGDLWIVPLDGGAARALTTDHQSLPWPHFDSDGKAVIFASLRGGSANLWEIPAAGGRAVQLTSGAGPDVPGDVAPDGQRLVFQTEQSVTQIFAYARGERAGRRLTPTLDNYLGFEVTPDDKTLVSTVRRGGKNLLVARPLAGDGEERVLAEGTTFTLTVDGTEAVYVIPGETTTRLHAVKIDSGEDRSLWELPGRVRRLFTGPDGYVRVLQWNQGELGCWRVPLAGGSGEREDLRPWLTVQELPGSGWRMAFRPSQNPERPHETGVYPPGLPLTEPPPVTFQADFYTWEQGGQAIFYTSGLEVRRHELATRRDERVLELDRPPQDLDVSADGKTLYVGQSSERVRRYDIVNFGERRRPRP